MASSYTKYVGNVAESSGVMVQVLIMQSVEELTVHSAAVSEDDIATPLRSF